MEARSWAGVDQGWTEEGLEYWVVYLPGGDEPAFDVSRDDDGRYPRGEGHDPGEAQRRRALEVAGGGPLMSHRGQRVRSKGPAALRRLSHEKTQGTGVSAGKRSPPGSRWDQQA